VTDLSHLDAAGRARMVGVGDKPETQRRAVAAATLAMRPATFRLIAGGRTAKGDLYAAARIAGIMAAKRTAELIPLCHPLSLSEVGIAFAPDEAGAAIHIIADVRLVGRTGAEMEALTAAAVAALTLYDMAKAVDRDMRISDVRLLAKSGGRSGDYRADDPRLDSAAAGAGSGVGPAAADGARAAAR
jgi:cyclic pyranopterin phosphate synthase